MLKVLLGLCGKDRWRDGGKAGDGLGNEKLAKETWKSRDPANEGGAEKGGIRS